MARLSDRDVTSLIERLGGERAPLMQPTSVQTPTVLNEDRPPSEAHETRARLHGLSGDGSLGPLITQRLAVYLGMPVRCTSGDAPELPDGGPLYTAQANGATLWLRVDALLASALADAMIGGDGDAPKVGYGPKVARTATGAVTEILRAIAQVLQLPEPSPAALEQIPRVDLIMAAGGSFSVATRDYGWQAGVIEPALMPRPAQSESPEPAIAAPAAAQPQILEVRGRGSGTVETALECARLGLEAMLGRGVAFESVQTETLVSPRVPLGWLGMSLTPRGGGTIVLAVNRLAEVALMKSALAADVELEAGGVLMETGAEVILRGALVAFAAELSGGSDDMHHIVRLSDNAVLAEVPHQSVVHRVICDSHSGVLRWLVPERH